MVREVRAPRILHKKDKSPLSKMFTTRFDAKNIYFEVCMSPPFLDKHTNIIINSFKNVREEFKYYTNQNR
jgi:hypothetical protein